MMIIAMHMHPCCSSCCAMFNKLRLRVCTTTPHVRWSDPRALKLYLAHLIWTCMARSFHVLSMHIPYQPNVTSLSPMRLLGDIYKDSETALKSREAEFFGANAEYGSPEFCIISRFWKQHSRPRTKLIGLAVFGPNSRVTLRRLPKCTSSMLLLCGPWFWVWRECKWSPQILANHQVKNRNGHWSLETYNQHELTCPCHVYPT